MREIKLTKGAIALIDDEDYERVVKFAWHLACYGKYAARRAYKENGSSNIVYLHHEILNIIPDINNPVDHINRNGLDCRKENLRITSTQTNILNRRIKAKGVSYDKLHNCYKVYYDHIEIGKPKRRFNIGTFYNEDTAITARTAWLRANKMNIKR